MRSHGLRCALGFLAAAAGSAVGQNIGPSTATAPYVLPSPQYGSLISTTSVLTVGDTIGGYRMVGLPDGLGAISNGNSFTLTMNHELSAGAGTVRANGTAGAFVSKWEIGTNLSVLSGRDLNTSSADVYSWNGAGYVSGPNAASRFCSADLAAPTAYRFGNLGTDARIHMNGEESGNEGRAWAHLATGAGANQSWELPRLGKFSWENSVANPVAQAKTVVMGTDDNTANGGVYMYVGNKQATGNDIERAGLTNGNLYGVRVQGLTQESRTAPPAAGTRFDLFNHGDVSTTTGAALNTAGVNAGVTSFLRPEDGAWDPRPGHQNDFYFVTTDRFNQAGQDGRSRLWKMAFDDIANPELGGAITCLMDGTQGQQMFDNITIDSLGRVLLQEDPGGNNYLARVWMYDITSGNYGAIAQHNAAFFGPGAPGLLTTDEESSGIIDAGALLGPGWFLLDSQAHYGIAGELVEGGQLLAMYVDPSVVPTPGTLGLLGLAGLMVSRRRRHG